MIKTSFSSELVFKVVCMFLLGTGWGFEICAGAKKKGRPWKKSHLQGSTCSLRNGILLCINAEVQWPLSKTPFPVKDPVTRAEQSLSTLSVRQDALPVSRQTKRSPFLPVSPHLPTSNPLYFFVFLNMNKFSSLYEAVLT